MQDLAELLQRIADDPGLIDDDPRIKALITKIHRAGQARVKTQMRATRRTHDRAATARAVRVRQLYSDSVSDPAVDQAELTVSSDAASSSRVCYICKQQYREVHAHYHLLCPTCAANNFAKRDQRVDLHNHIALLTGGRIKIGHVLALRMLRDGATVHVTTRFAHDAAARFAAEPDAADWLSRLHLHTLDLRDLPAVEAFVAHMNQALPHLDILINNAAQTVKRPLAFYQHLLDSTPVGQSHGDIQLAKFAGLLEARPGYRGSLTHAPGDFPDGKFDADGQQLDLRSVNSWRLRLHEVAPVEMIEVLLVNAAAPFMLNSGLKPVLQRSPHVRRFIVNVSAMEGQFNRAGKTEFHPHTNMAKAALNMLTRTSGADYAADNIYMTAVDTGWITDENPAPVAAHTREHYNFYPPLDVIDGMARVYDPIVRGLTEDDTPEFGAFLKDYKRCMW
jgi:NAD(P)-dependent dehydrogenase (short-subunit alcohol dehydrogenase family)